MKKHCVHLTVSLLVLVAVLTIIEQLVSSFQCPGSADESWFWYITRHDIPSQFSFFVKYLGFAREWPFEAQRLLMVTLRILSGCFLGWSFFKSFKSYGLSLIDAWVIVLIIPTLYGFSQEAAAPCYVRLNYAFGCVSVGCFLFAMKGGMSRVVSEVLMICSGAAVAQCVFIMPPNALVVLVMLLALIVLDKRMSVVYMVGGLVGIIIFFTVFCSPVSFFDSINFFLTLNYANTDGHDMMVLIRWLYSAVIEYFPIVLFAVVFSYSVKSLKERRFAYDVVIALLMVYALWHSYILLRSGSCRCSMVRVDLCVLYFVTVALIAHHAKERTLLDKDVVLTLVLLAVPVFLSFGTNIVFDNRATRYMIFLMLPCWLLTRKYESKLGYAYFGFMSMVYIAAMLWHLGQNSGYSFVRLIDSNTSLREFGTNCIAPTQLRDDLRKIRDMTKDRPLVVGGRDSWRTIALFHKKPVSTLWYKPELIMPILKKEKPDKDKMFILEQKNFIITPEFEKEVAEFLGATQVERKIVSDSASIVIFR